MANETAARYLLYLSCTALTTLCELVSSLLCPARLLFFTRLHHSRRHIFLPRLHTTMDTSAYSARP